MSMRNFSTEGEGIPMHIPLPASEHVALQHLRAELEADQSEVSS